MMMTDIRQLADICDVKPYVLRFWETEFEHFGTTTNEDGLKVYTQNDISFVYLLKHLLFIEGLTIDKAKFKIDELRSQFSSYEEMSNSLKETLQNKNHPEPVNTPSPAPLAKEVSEAKLRSQEIIKELKETVRLFKEKYKESFKP